MAYLDSNSRTASATQQDRFIPMGRQTVYHGLFVGYVKRADDVQKNGRLSVWIPDLGSPPDEENGWITVSYCSPFAGATNIDTISRNDFKSFEATQTSYGMWMVPPDINNPVAVMFIGGNPAYGIWIGCLYQQFMNHMVPGSPVSVNNAQYQGKAVPVAEYNKWDTQITDPERAQRPYNKTKFDGIANQGLVRDPWRGLTTSGARREAPSEVFGILTPGPAVDATAAPPEIRRKGGSSFIMDDKTGSEYIQLATKSGAQIKIDETHGFVYLINRDGTGWVQMDKEGNIDVFGAKDISLRAQRDINLRADRNVNIEAGQNIFMKAAKDTTEQTETVTRDVNNKPETKTITTYRYVGEGKGTGGNIVAFALNNWHSTTYNKAFLTVQQQDFNIVAKQSIFVTTEKGGQNFLSELGIKHTTKGSVETIAKDTIKMTSEYGISAATGGDFSVCSKKQLSLNGDEGVAVASYSEIGITGYTRMSDDLYVGGSTKVRGSIVAGSSITEYASVGGEDVLEPVAPLPPIAARPAALAEVKPMNDKLNVLYTWNDADKFYRNTSPIYTTVSRLPTLEPCPEHENFRLSAVRGYTLEASTKDETYGGSSGQGSNTGTPQPPSSEDSSEANKEIMPDGVEDNTTAKNFDYDAFRCQLIKHEGRKNTVYNDTVGLATAGIGHLLRSPVETDAFPLGSTVSDARIEAWYKEDAAIAIRGAISLLGDQNWERLSGVRKRAMADLCYNLGKPRLSKFVKFLDAMRAEDWRTAGTELENSKWYGQVKSRGPTIVTMITKNIDPTGCGV